MKVDRFCEFLRRAEQTLEHYVNYRPTSLNLKALVEFGQNAPASKSFLFLRHELPIRIANTMQEVCLLPERLLRTESVMKVAELYNETFTTLVKYEKCDPFRPSVISEFTDDLRTVFQKHSDVVAQMAMGLKEFKETGAFSMEEDMQLHYFLDRFYISRIGIRMLINQHTLIYGPNLCENPKHIGAIDPDCSPLRLAISAYAYGRMLCMRTFGRAPGAVIETIDRFSGSEHAHQFPELSVTVDEHGTPSGAPTLFAQQPSCANLSVRGRDLTFCYVPGHLFHIIFELTKNAMRAVVERTTEESALPDLHFLISHAHEDVTIRISDCGGGMPRNMASQAFKYTFTTASHLPTADQLCKDADNQSGSPPKTNDFGPDPERSTFSPLAGRGHGLPLSRLYARYLSGDLKFISTEGYGSSAYIYVKRLPENARELLPIFSHTSRAVYRSSSLSNGDWISGREIRNDQLLTMHPHSGTS